ncbi:PREDICTED: WD repeat-containing protein 66 [Elephantulus edwardii]|uniref:WD repeat-containing protein 66 n=1 Tax=Elephantulus edwardii TaxID=28737 RepID=UPI0003F0AC99|nr:PREDICTED: WD repeat-containing protein 66 [Elephantulus edwardii]
MSDVEENPPEETEEDEETEMEEEENSSYQEREEEENPNYKRIEGDRRGEREYSSNSQRIEEEEEDYNLGYQRMGEDYNVSYRGIEEYNPNYLRIEEEEEEEGEEYNPKSQRLEEEEGREEENSNYPTVEDKDNYPLNYQKEEDAQQGSEAEDTSAGMSEELAGQAVGEEGEFATVAQEVTQTLKSMEQLLFPGAKLPKKRVSDSEVLLGSSELERLDLDQSTSVEIQSSEERVVQPGMPQDKERPEQRQQAKISYISEPSEVSDVSLVASTSEEDALFKKGDDKSKVFPLTMTWTFGWNSSLPVFNLRDGKRLVLLYVCGHTGVIYDVSSNRQHHLEGHSNVISCLCVSEDRRWVATADTGPDCLIMIWDSFTGIPVHTIFDSCPDGSGINAIAISSDAKYLATISDGRIQQVCIWKWTLAAETPACTLQLHSEYGSQNYITFNPTNAKELVSNSKTRAIYYNWLEEKNKLVHSAPLLTEKTFNKLVGKFSQSVFHLNSRQILSATKEGKLVVWDVHRPRPSAAVLSYPYIRPCKLVHLQKEGITVLTTVDSYIVTGDVKGNIKFYDSTLSIVNWYSNLQLGAIQSLSFSKTPPPSSTEKSNYPPDCTLKGDFFIVRNFLIGTSDATVYHLTTDGTKLQKLFVEPKDAICAIACHPYQPLLAVGSFCGMIKVWDYRKKIYLFSRCFEKGLGIKSLTYNPEGAILGAGFVEGTVYILDAMSLQNETAKPFRYSRSSVTHISFSHDSQYMATADLSCTVVLFHVVVRHGKRVWEYLARLCSHRKSIQSLLFGVYLDSNEPRLLSLGQDRLLIEYNLSKTTKDHLDVLDIHRTDQGGHPTCMVWYPPLTKELFLLICNSDYKVKLFNSTTKMCRKTLLGPTYGSPIEQVQLLPVKTSSDLQKRYLAFINRDKVGLQILPVDGNPHKTCAIICHPNGVSSLTLSFDGCYAFTAGGKDRSVSQWEINLSALDAAVSLGGDDLTPFYSLVTGGREGQFYRELEDYFYYSHLRSQGIDTMEPREVSEHIRLPELPFVMRAIGFYPSEEAIDNMFNEIRFGEYVDTGQLVDKINLPDFLKVYINHRPPFGTTMSEIQHSFDVLGYTNPEGKKAIRREDFLRLLQTKGEHMTQEEMVDCFSSLYGVNPEGWKSEPATSSFRGPEFSLEEELPEEITAEIFATEILGLTISEEPNADQTASEE